MTSLRGLYDPTDKADSGFEVLPAGIYTVKVTAGEMKKTKKGNGEYLQVEMTVVEGEHADRKIFDRFNLVNPSAEAVKIARGQFAALREAVGVLDPVDIAALMGPRFQVKVKCVKRNDKPDEMTNEVAGYIKRGQTATTPPQQSAGAPWARNAPKAPPPAQTPPPSAALGDEKVPW